MKFLQKIFVAFIANACALLAAAYLIPEVTLSEDITRIALVAAILTILNFFVKPFIKLLASPFIILTLGVGLFIINVLILYLLDFLSKDLTIQGILPLLFAAAISSVVNMIAHFITKSK